MSCSIRSTSSYRVGFRVADAMACWRNSCASRSVSARSRPASLADRPSKSICDRSMSGSGLVPSAAARMTYSSAPTERSSSASTASVTEPRSASAGRVTSAMRSASTLIAATLRCCAAALGSGRRALKSFRTWRAFCWKSVRVPSSTSSASTAASRLATWSNPSASRIAARSTPTPVQKANRSATAASSSAARASIISIGESPAFAAP